jgi:hypothetical protein
MDKLIELIKQPTTHRGIVVIAALVLYILYQDKAKDIILGAGGLYGLLLTFGAKN